MALKVTSSRFTQIISKYLASISTGKVADAGAAENDPVYDRPDPFEMPPVDVTPMALNPHRVELPGNFPDTISLWNSPESVVAAIDRELKKTGTTVQEIDRIYLAYPHKDRTLFPGHYDNASNTVQNFQQRITSHLPHIQFYAVDEVVETVRLGRSEDQSSVHALTARQVYRVADNPQQEKPFQFKNAETGKPEFFLVLDACVEQGTTLANFMSYITLQGGHVLAAVAGNEQKLVQRETATMAERVLVSEGFRDSSHNTGRLVQLAEAFSKSAKRDGIELSPAKCLDIFEGRMKLLGNTVLALTDGECERLIETLENRHYGGGDTFKSLMSKLDEKIKEGAKGKPPSPFRPYKRNSASTLGA